MRSPRLYLLEILDKRPWIDANMQVDGSALYQNPLRPEAILLDFPTSKSTNETRTANRLEKQSPATSQKSPTAISALTWKMLWDLAQIYVPNQHNAVENTFVYINRTQKDDQGEPPLHDPNPSHHQNLRRP